MRQAVQPNCIDIVGPLIGELDRAGLLDRFQLMGGIGSAALMHVGTVILPYERRIVTSRDFTRNNRDIHIKRPNGTLRDLDALVLSSDQSRIEDVERVAQSVAQDRLELSVFGFRPISHLEDQIEHPFRPKSLKTFVSDRYEDELGAVEKALTPFSVSVTPDALEGWMVEAGGFEFPVMNPGAVVLNYSTRSISGLRPKDREKVETMARHISNKWPGMNEWIACGPGKSQLQLAHILQTLRHGGLAANKKANLNLGGGLEIKTGNLALLERSPAFLYHDDAPALRRATLAMAVIKSRGLGVPESNPTIVRLFQKFAEKKFVGITKNR